MDDIQKINTLTIEGAKEFLLKKDEFLTKHGSGCMAGLHPKGWKPASIQFDWLFPKVSEAKRTLGLNIWQMEYKDAVKVERGLTLSTWNRLKIKHN